MEHHKGVGAVSEKHTSLQTKVFITAIVKVTQAQSDWTADTTNFYLKCYDLLNKTFCVLVYTTEE